MYAVYQAGGPVYGVGTTPEAAETNAMEWLNPTESSAIVQISDRAGETEGQLYCRACSPALVDYVAAFGGQVRYEVRPGGLLCLTTED